MMISHTVRISAGGKTRHVTKTKPHDSARTAVTIVYFMMLALFLPVASAAALSTYEGLRSHFFVEVEGIVTERTIGRSSNNAPAAKGFLSRSSYLLVKYRYEVEGVEYEGTRLGAGTFGLSSGEDVTRFASRVKVGEPVAVYVDPGNPLTAVLERGLSSITWMMYVLAGFLGFATLFLRVFYLAFNMPPVPEKPKTPVFGRQPRP